MLRYVFAVLLLGTPVSAWAEAKTPGTYQVNVDTLEERLGPSASARVTNRDHRGQVLEVYEVKNGWARVSAYYDGAIEGMAGMVATWVKASGLAAPSSTKAPPSGPPSDPRIAADALPKAGDRGLTAQDVKYLNEGALKFLNSGRCLKVEYGDKSVSKPNTYYVSCGGTNIFFTPEDLK